MAILAALVALGSRFAGKILTTTLGWASTLLFGRVPADRQMLLLGITFGSVIWVVLLVGVIVPPIGTFLLVFVPPQGLVPESLIRLGMLIGAMVAPAAIGLLTLALTRQPSRDAGSIVKAVLRGYPLTALLAVVLVFLAGLAAWRKAASIVRGTTDAHVPIVVQPGAYSEVASDLDAAVTAAGLGVVPRPAPAAMSKPARWLAMVGGPDAGALVPDRMIELRGEGISILIYPMDLLLSGRPEHVARARAAMASRLSTARAHLAVTAEGQAIEDRLATLAGARDAVDTRPIWDGASAAALAAIDEELMTIEVPYDEWEVLYRKRLQVERDLRARAMADDVGGPTMAAAATAGRLVREGVDTILDAAADERTPTVLGRLGGGWKWRLAGVVAAVVAVGLRVMAGAPARPAEPGLSDRSLADDRGL